MCAIWTRPCNPCCGSTGARPAPRGRIRAADVPALPGVHAYIAAGYLTRGAETNPVAYGEQVHFDQSVTPAKRTFLWEVETSGGLLLAVPVDKVKAWRAAASQADLPHWMIGEVISGTGIQVG